MLGTPPDRGSTAPPSSTGSRFISIAANHPGCLGLRSDGTVEWIHRGYSSPTHLPIPERLIGVAAIAVGENHVLALLEDGTVTAWTSRPELHLIDFPTDLDEVVAIAAGEAHSLALKSNGEVVAWGWTEGHRPTWVPSELQPVTQIAAGDEYNLAIQEDGSVVIWGTRYVPTGPAPDPRDIYRTRMARAEDWQWTYVTDATAIVAGDELGLNILRDGTVGVVRNKDRGYGEGAGYLLSDLSDVSSVTIARGDRGHEYVVAARKNGTIVIPKAPHDHGNNVRDVVAVAANRLSTTYALKRDGTVEWWTSSIGGR